jgi:thioredoxin reductase/SAM-dependent methyltransferase
MSTHTHASIERHCDVAVVGGSAAGLAAALQMLRQRRSVIVVDAGEPRNAPAAHMHGFLGREAQPPSALTGAGRVEVRSYGGEVLDGRVQRVTRAHGGEGEAGSFRVELVGDVAIVARRVLVATGIVDELPAIAGLAEHWGSDVVHCPFCHGYEIRDQRVVQIVTHPMGLHPAPLLRQLTDRLTVVVHDDAVMADAHATERLELLRAGGVEVVVAPVSSIVSGDGGGIAAVELDGHEPIPADAVVVGPRFRPRVEPFEALGLEATPHASGLGDVVAVDPTGATSIDGVYAAGNVTDPGQQVLQAAAAGSLTGAMICFSLAEEDLRAAARPSPNRIDWDQRYAGDQMWSGNPNGTLVAEVAGLPVGRALDVGAGEGGDAVWLAEQGWTVTAADVSSNALARVAAEADRRGLTIDRLRVDANDVDPFDAGGYDLVSAQYASIPRTPDDRAIHNLLAAVAPGGTLVVVGHDLEPMRAPIDTTEHSRAFDPDAYVGPHDVAEVVSGLAGWEVELHEKRPRPPGSATAHHHVDDIVVRARRTD